MRINWKPAVKNIIAYGLIAGALLVTVFFTSPSASFSAAEIPEGGSQITIVSPTIAGVNQEAMASPNTDTVNQKEMASPNPDSVNQESSASTNPQNINQETRTQPSEPVKPHEPAVEAMININTAAESELDTLPGIGPVKAAAIVDWRTENGLYKNVNDLLMVKGIGDKTLEKLIPLICCE